VKIKKSDSREKLHLAKETIRHLLSEDLQKVAGGLGCSRLPDCTGQTTFNCSWQY